MENRKYLWRSALYYLLTGLLISGLAFVNHYPLVYSDSGAYMLNSFRLYQVDDRPIGYGLIIRAVTWQGSMWPVVIFQGAVASWLLMLMVREFVRDPDRWLRIHLILVTLLVLCSSLPWYSAQLMADHYTPLLLIVSFLIFRGTSLGPWREGALWVLMFFFLATHNAHLLMAAAMSLLLLLTTWRSGWRKKRAFWARWAGFNLSIAGAALMIMAFHYSGHGRMQLSRAGNVFLAGRLCEPGIMADFLHKTCPTKDNPLCKYKDHLTEDAGGMLWTEEGFVHAEHLTIGQADSLLAPVIRDILKDPEYALRFARSAVVSTAVQLFQWDAGAGLDAYGVGSAPHWSLNGKIPDEMYSYLHSRQQWGYWTENRDANRLGAIALVLSLLIIILHWIGKDERMPSGLRKLSLWVIAWIVLNAAITSSLAVVDSRLQARVMWLLPMVAFLMLVQQPSLRDLFKLGLRSEQP